MNNRQAGGISWALKAERTSRNPSRLRTKRGRRSKRGKSPSIPRRKIPLSPPFSKGETGRGILTVQAVGDTGEGRVGKKNPEGAVWWGGKI
jgi:hypothetical protein